MSGRDPPNVALNLNRVGLQWLARRPAHDFAVGDIKP